MANFFKKYFKKRVNTTSVYSDNLKFLEDVLAEEDPEFAETLKVIQQQSQQLQKKGKFLDYIKELYLDIKHHPHWVA